MVKKSINSCVYCNMQSHGLVTPKNLMKYVSHYLPLWDLVAGRHL